MAYGRPVVQFDLTEGRPTAAGAALYARPNDPADFAQKTILLLDSGPLRQELGALGRQRAEELFNWDRQKKVLIKAYQMVLGEATATTDLAIDDEPR